ncbi:MAG: DUF4345 domain-containing protein [Xanthobacteraceae bacterium]
MPASQRTVQICLFVMAAIALAGGVLQMSLGQPDTTPRLDNVHRFLAGIYLGCGIIAAWAAITVRQQGTLIDLIALGVALGGFGRVVSMAKVGLPDPGALWIGYAASEFILPLIIVVAHRAGPKGGRAD